MVTFLFLVMFMQFFLVLADGGGGGYRTRRTPPPLPQLAIGLVVKTMVVWISSSLVAYVLTTTPYLWWCGDIVSDQADRPGAIDLPKLADMVSTFTIASYYHCAQS